MKSEPAVKKESIEMAETSIEVKTQILADLWIDYKGEEKFLEFFEYNDLGLPLAYAISEKIVPSTPESDKYIIETFSIFLESYKMEDTGFENLDEIMA